VGPGNGLHVCAKQKKNCTNWDLNPKLSSLWSSFNTINMAASDISFKHQIHHQGLTSRALLF